MVRKSFPATTGVRVRYVYLTNYPRPHGLRLTDVIALRLEDTRRFRRNLVLLFILSSKERLADSFVSAESCLSVRCEREAKVFTDQVSDGGGVSVRSELRNA
jgi:hypothetical protein